MPAPSVIKEIVERFERNYQDYKSGKYNEMNLRREFLDPFFKALGWDTDNSLGYAEFYKDVVHEYPVKVGAATKSPDYCFKVANIPKFFVEAKRPSVNIKEDKTAVYQLRRYAWSAKLPLSILTDFEEMAVYDCRVKPQENDKTTVARIHFWKFSEYIEKWDEIANIFSKEALLKGSFDKYAESKRIKGTFEIDEAFLLEIESWRENLAKNIAENNPEINQKDLNYAVQMLIDRIIFLRICEDRGIEPYEQLKKLENYKSLCKLFKLADKRYNSGLFHFSVEKERSETQDTITLNLTIDDQVLESIIKGLYYPQCPYEFSVLSADILGQVYEQFLGKVIYLNDKHQVIIDEKPIIKKAGGVFYTPSYIVYHIVQNTIGKLLSNKKPSQVSNIAILDPACGSGSFLIGAFQFLIDWHIAYYLNQLKDIHRDTVGFKRKFKDQMYQSTDGTWRLTTEEKKRILKNNIFGVDIDEQAVEVTKLSLLLKVLEDEYQFELLQQRILPDLGENIKCGNALVGSDIYATISHSKLSGDEILKIKPFDWDQAFPNVKERGGFDVIIGNPPYIKEYTNKSAFDYLHSSPYYQGKMDIWTLFACQAIDMMKTNGYFSFIAPNNWTTNFGASIFRDKILQEGEFESYIDFGDYKVFKNADIQTMIYTFRKRNARSSYDFQYIKIQNPKAELMTVKAALDSPVDGLDVQAFTVTFEPSIYIGSTVSFLPDYIVKVLEHIEASKALQLTSKEVFQGIVVPQEAIQNSHREKLVQVEIGEGIFVLSQQELDSLHLSEKETGLIKPFYTSNEIERFYGNPSNKLWLIYTKSDSNKTIEEYPNIKRHLNKYQAIFTSDFKPYGLHRARNESLFQKDKILSIRKCGKPTFSYIDFDSYVSQTFNIIKSESINLKYLTALLNSKVLEFWFKYRGKMQGNNFQIDQEPLLRCPIAIASSQTEKRITGMVDLIIEYKRQSYSSNSESSKAPLSNQIKMLEKELNKVFFELYRMEGQLLDILTNNI